MPPLTSAPARAVLLATLFLVGAHFTAYTYLTPLLRQVFRLSPEVATSLLVVYGASGFLGTFLGGWLATRSAPRSALLAALAALAIAAVLGFAALADGGLPVGAVVALAWGRVVRVERRRGVTLRPGVRTPAARAPAPRPPRCRPHRPT